MQISANSYSYVIRLEACEKFALGPLFHGDQDEAL